AALPGSAPSAGARRPCNLAAPLDAASPLPPRRSDGGPRYPSATTPFYPGPPRLPSAPVRRPHCTAPLAPRATASVAPGTLLLPRPDGPTHAAGGPGCHNAYSNPGDRPGPA